MPAISPIYYGQIRSHLLSKLPQLDGDSRIEESSASDHQSVLPLKIAYARGEHSSYPGGSPGFVQVSTSPVLVDPRIGEPGSRELTIYFQADPKQDRITFDTKDTSAFAIGLDLASPIPHKLTLCDDRPLLSNVDTRLLKAMIRRLEIDTHNSKGSNGEKS